MQEDQNSCLSAFGECEPAASHMSSVGLLHVAGSALPFPGRCSGPLGALRTGAGHEGAWLSAGQEQDLGTRGMGFVLVSISCWLPGLGVSVSQPGMAERGRAADCPHFMSRWQTRSCQAFTLPRAGAECVLCDCCWQEGCEGRCRSEAPSPSL